MVWYASYGSNLCAERFHCYLRGGTPPGASGACRGARDPSPPRRDRALEIPHRLYFAGFSTMWDGAPCLIDTVATPSTPARARAYLITWEQFEDVVAQENRRATSPIEFGVEPADLAPGFSRHAGAGRYDTLLCVGRIEEHPVVTFTSARTLAEADAAAELRAPSPAYLTMLVAGLREAHGISDEAVVTYLGAAPGCSDALVSSTLAIGS